MNSSADRNGMERQEGRPIIQTSTSATSDIPLPFPAKFKVSTTSVETELPAVAERTPKVSMEARLLKKPVKNQKSPDISIEGTYHSHYTVEYRFSRKFGHLQNFLLNRNFEGQRNYNCSLQIF